RSPFAAVIFFQRVIDKFLEILPEPIEALWPLERFVVAEESEDHVGLFVGEPLIRRAEALRTEPGHDLVAGKPQIAKDQVLLRESFVDERFQVTRMLHSVGEGIADDA